MRMRIPTWCIRGVARSHTWGARMSSFFLPAKASKKDRKRKKTPSDKKKARLHGDRKGHKKKISLNEEIASDSDTERAKGDNVRGEKEGRVLDVEEEEEETAPEKRLRLAKDYLARLEEEERNQQELADIDHDAISHRLQQDVLEQSGRLQRSVAEQYSAPGEDGVRLLKSHQLPVTCIAITPDDKHIYSGSKDCCIIKWNVETGSKEVILPGKRGGLEGVTGHSGQVLALAVSSDGKFMVSGGQDKVVHVWSGETSVHIHTFTGHRDAVSGLAFQKGTHELFSASFDRTVKIWNLDEMAYVETLFGHQDCISAIDCLTRERPVTAGCNDRTLRLWKVAEESQLVFHGHKASIDTVAVINGDHFVSGSQDGSVALWSTTRKKSLVTRQHALEEGAARDQWVSSVAAYPNTDLVASGSSNGFVQLWKCGEKFHSLELCFSIALPGVVNALSFSHNGDYLVAAVGQEHRFGRWWKQKQVKNSVAIIALPRNADT